MPGMDGITFLKKLMRDHPMPVVVLSSVTPQGSKTAIEALDAGAVEIVCKPDGSGDFSDVCRALVEKIQIASRPKIKTKTGIGYLGFVSSFKHHEV